MKDPTSQLRTATRRAKSDVANKLVSMFLHELSRKLSQNYAMKVDSEEYGNRVRDWFRNLCPYCGCDLQSHVSVIEHLDGMNRYRAGLHVAGNVLVACRNCNSEKRRDDSQRVLLLASTGWESFLSHTATRCDASCRTCLYWSRVWEDTAQREEQMSENLERIRSFRRSLGEREQVPPSISAALPDLLTKLYSDCQIFAEREINGLLKEFEQTFGN